MLTRQTARSAAALSMRAALAPRIGDLVATNDDLMVLGADGQALATDVLTRWPERYLEVGIAEANLVGVAAGLARTGVRPIVTAMAPFLVRRAYEQVRLDVCNSGLDVTFIGVGGGLSYGRLGATHHAIEDLALFAAMPHTKVFNPVDVHDAAWALDEAVAWPGPAYIRLGARPDPVVFSGDEPFGGNGVWLSHGADALIVASGASVPVAVEACESLRRRGVHAALLAMTCVKPFPAEEVRAAAAGTAIVVCVEEHVDVGGIGSRVGGLLAGTWTGRFTALAIDDRPSPLGSREELFEHYRIDAVAVQNAVLDSRSGEGTTS